MFVCSCDQPVSFHGYQLILPSISVGNVGQLSVDLLINTLKLPRVGYLHDPSLLPLVGNNAFDHNRESGHLHTSVEVYCSHDLKVALVQMRAPVAKGFQQSFLTGLLQWIREARFSQTVLLTSSHAHERRDSQITGSQFRYLLTPSCSDLYPHFSERLKWTALEPRVDDGVPEQLSDDVIPGTLSEPELFLPGAGLTKKIYLKGSSEGVRLVVLVAFCSQGDNTGDAKALVAHLNQWMELCSGQAWQCPDSWSLMYGGPSPGDIF